MAQISEPLATADIPAYYISTFKFDHALVRQEPPKVVHFNDILCIWCRTGAINCLVNQHNCLISYQNSPQSFSKEKTQFHLLFYENMLLLF